MFCNRQDLELEKDLAMLRAGEGLSAGCPQTSCSQLKSQETEKQNQK